MIMYTAVYGKGPRQVLGADRMADSLTRNPSPKVGSSNLPHPWKMTSLFLRPQSPIFNVAMSLLYSRAFFPQWDCWTTRTVAFASRCACLCSCQGAPWPPGGSCNLPDASYGLKLANAQFRLTVKQPLTHCSEVTLVTFSAGCRGRTTRLSALSRYSIFSQPQQLCEPSAKRALGLAA